MCRKLVYLVPFVLVLMSVPVFGDAILAPGDFIIAIDADSASSSPGAEPVTNAIDRTTAKYLNFGEDNSGFIVTPAFGSSVVTSFEITTANDAEERDPATWALYGTNEPILSANHSAGTSENWTLIASGSVTLPAARNTLGPMVAVTNSTSYKSHKMLFTTVKNAGTANSMQIAEIQFYGVGKTARNPRPADGAAVPPLVSGTNVYMVLDYDAGGGAVTHTAYFSDVKADVETRDPAHSLGSPPWPGADPEAYYVGYDDPLIPAFARTPLVPGKTYYWCVDEFDGTETLRGSVWSFTVMPEEAWGPTPIDGDTSVLQDPNVLLSWRLGNVPTADYTIKYPLYYSTSKTAVDTGTTPNVTVSTTSKSVGGLPSDTTIYWRVDTKLNSKVPPFPLYKLIKGKTWSFKTLPVVAITDPDLVAWYKLDGEFPSLVFDYSGYANHGTLQGNPQYVAGKIDDALELNGSSDYVDCGYDASLNITGAVTIAAWVNLAAGARDQKIAGNMDNSTGGYKTGVYTDDNLEFEIRNSAGQNAITRGIAGGTVLTQGVWHHVVAVYSEAGGYMRTYVDGGLDKELATTNILGGSSGALRLGREPYNTVNYLAGMLDDVRIYKRALSAKEIKVLSGRLGASDPNPANGATDVERSPTLSWEEGAFVAAVSGHQVYFGDDSGAVAGRTAPKTVLNDPSYAVSTLLELGTTYYWAVDEVNEPNVWPGDLWSFTTVNYLVVDDMEEYRPNLPDPNIYEVWVDGSGDCKSIAGNNSGALVDISTLVGLGPVHGDQQAMKLVYDNDGTVDNPCTGAPAARLTYSKAEALVAKLPSGIGSDWTAGDVTKALSLWFYGDPLNSVEPMWVRLTDASNNTAKVLYGKYADEDVKDVNEASWHEWLIDLADFTGVNVANVKSIAIGIGNETGPAGRSGTLYFDDIRLYTPRCVLTRRPADYAKVDYAPEGNPAGDCVVDGRELEIMTRDWLEVDYTAPSLMARYLLDGNYNDSSGNGHHGTPVGAGITFVADVPPRTQVLALPGGDNIYVNCGAVGISGAMPRTIACWAKADNTSIPDWTLVFGFTGSDQCWRHFNIDSIGGPGGVGAHCWCWEETIFTDTEALEWRHYAMTYDGTTVRYYGDGVPMDTDPAKSNVMDLDTVDLVHIGKRTTNTNSFPGLVDDACVFDRALTDAEIVTVKNGGAASVSPYHPVSSPANVVDPEAANSRAVNFKDYAELLLKWLDETEWPLP